MYGNFFGDGEGRGNGCPNRAPSMESWPPPGPNIITLRGPGNGDIGYCFITATTTNFTGTGPYPSTLPGNLQGPTTELPPGAPRRRPSNCWSRTGAGSTCTSPRRPTRW